MKDHLGENPEVVGVISATVVAYAAVSAFFLSVISNYADRWDLFISGALLAAGIANLWMALRFGWSKWWIGWGGFITTWGFVQIVIATLGAGAAYQANVDRCSVLQADMLSEHPKRQDGAALFSALQCQPRIEGAVSMPIPAPLKTPTGSVVKRP